MSGEYKNLSSDIGFVANNIPEIRHAGNEEFNFDKLSESEKEGWYDKLFTLFLGAIQLKEHEIISQEIKRIKSAPKKT